jgi:hypothetical protein
MRPSSLGVRASGRIRFGLILGLAVVALGIYTGVQLAYHYWAYWHLREEAERQSLELVVRDTPMQNETSRQMLVNKAQEFDVTLDPKEIAITSLPGQVTIAFSFERTLEFPGYTFPINFHVTVSSRRVRR